MPQKRGRRTDSFPHELGANIRRYREERRFTQRDLSLAARYDLAQLSSVENGLAVPRADALRRIADALDVSIDRLCGRSVFAAEESAAASGSPAVSDELRELRRRVENLEAWRDGKPARSRSRGS
jgi:transcriptional regulator with XRE-family HTH domain